MRSLSEIETTSKRASKAAGFAWGISEEIGKGVRLLELFNLKGIKSLNEFLKKKSKEKFEHLGLISPNNRSKKYPYCPISLGVSFLDQIKNLEKMNKVRFSKISYPLLLLPFLSRSSEMIGKRIHVKFDKVEFLLNFNINILTKFNKDDCPISANNTKIYFIENVDNFTKKDWDSLYKLSEKTFVKETESLKKGAAGAGLTDND